VKINYNTKIERENRLRKENQKKWPKPGKKTNQISWAGLFERYGDGRGRHATCHENQCKRASNGIAKTP
jgi:hypothetical protein